MLHKQRGNSAACCTTVRQHFGYRVLPLVFIVALVATILDVCEVVYQLSQANYEVSLLAIGVALSRLATVLVSGRAWRVGQRPFSPVAAR